ncbi:hypothetical protein APR41_05465 [Salegentibacter salinarum]|uniref:Uncharacterized protein n=1 Tax=Salegentibacter salinarum TaxID=447422 RepID=A0A2N0TSD8_9FLAO|nr:hypothetical protein [Salegentibacter salinarum]PKD17657.1 hypothetical protein APR41_05465 [Salegentibacter salinarum]SKB50498.1 hypothetical protein SAMN05660903_01119 [Salegentibacter salinarum]
MIEIQKKLLEFIHALKYELKSDYIHFPFNQPLQEFLDDKKIDKEKIRDKELNIQYKDLGFKIYNSQEDFLTIDNVKRNEDVLIIDYDGKTLSKISTEIFVDFVSQENYYFFKNAQSFLEFIELIKSKDKESEDGFHFIDYVNDVTRKIVITSLKERSRLILNYDKKIPNFDPLFDYSNALLQFEKCFDSEKNNLPRFLKSSLIEQAQRYDSKERMKLLFQNLDKVIEDAKITFEVYINNLSIDQIRKDYDEYKSKYFSEVSDILKKITQQIIGFPIVVASTLFALQRIKDNNDFLYVLAIVLFLTTIYLILLLNMNFRDLDYIKHLSKEDYKTLEKNRFFTKFPEQIESFKKIKSRVSTRITNLEIICESYFWILSVGHTFIIGLILNYLGLNSTALFMICLGILFLMGITKNKVWQEKNVA